jgi:hypothetical protein
MDTSVTVLVGSAISAVVAMGVVALQYMLERRRQSLVDRAERPGEFLSTSFAVSSGIEIVARAAPADKERREGDVRSDVEDRLNRSLTRLRLFEDEDLVLAATLMERN